MDSTERQCTREVYRTKARTPRQTVYNRKKKLAKGKSLSDVDAHVDAAGTNLLSTSNTENSSETHIRDLISEDTSEGITDFSNDTETPFSDYSEINSTTLSNHNVPVDDESKEEESTAALMLYEGCSLTTESSLLLLNSYVSHHNLTQQACQDLLQLLRLHLPKENAMPL